MLLTMVDQSGQEQQRNDEDAQTPAWWLARAAVFLKAWQRESSADDGAALDKATEAYQRGIAVPTLSIRGGNAASRDLEAQIEAHISLAKLDFVTGDSASVHAALSRLCSIVRDHPYSDGIEEAIYLTAVGQSALPASEQNTATKQGKLEFLEYLGDGYAPARAGVPTALFEPRWDSDGEVTQNGGNFATKTISSTSHLEHQAEERRRGDIYVKGLPAWALQFQIALSALAEGHSQRAMGAMENAFLCYETWLPRPHGNSGRADDDVIRRTWYKGVPNWSVWLKHPRPWLDLGDTMFRKGVGYFHVAAEVYEGALQRADNVLSPERWASISFRIAKCLSRCGDIEGAVARMEQLLYSHNFWDDRYRSHLQAWSEPWRIHFVDEDAAALKLQLFWRFTAAKVELRLRRAQKELVIEYKHWKRRIALKHAFHDIKEYFEASKTVKRSVVVFQCMYRVSRARQLTSSLRTQRQYKDALIQASLNKFSRNLQKMCWEHWVLHHKMAVRDAAATIIQGLSRGATGRARVKDLLMGRRARAKLEEFAAATGVRCLLRRCLRRLGKHAFLNRRGRAATAIQAMARGVAGREISNDERQRRAGIARLLLKTLEKLGGPVMREWRAVAHAQRLTKMATKIQARWRMTKAQRDWALMQSKIARALSMGHEAIGRNRQLDKLRVVETWKAMILERKLAMVQRMARVWLSKRRASRLRKQKQKGRELRMRIMKPIRRQCFVALVRNRSAQRKRKAAAANILQCCWRCRVARRRALDAREYSLALREVFDTTVRNHERRVLRLFLRAWKEQISREKAAIRLQAVWRGWQGALAATWNREREIRFEEVARVINIVYRGMVREHAFKQWRLLTLKNGSVTKVIAQFRGFCARKAFSARVCLLRTQQETLCRVGSTKRKLLMNLATHLWGDHCRRWDTFCVFQARVRGWLIRRRMSAARTCAEVSAGLFLVKGIAGYVFLDRSCCQAQALWRRVNARTNANQVFERVRIVGEVFARVSDARCSRVMSKVFAVWREVLEQERYAVVGLQSLVRGGRGRRRALRLGNDKRRVDSLVASFQRDRHRRLLLRCFRGIESCQVDAYAAALFSFASETYDARKRYLNSLDELDKSAHIDNPSSQAECQCSILVPVLSSEHKSLTSNCCPESMPETAEDGSSTTTKSTLPSLTRSVIKTKPVKLAKYQNRARTTRRNERPTRTGASIIGRLLETMDRNNIPMREPSQNIRAKSLLLGQERKASKPRHTGASSKGRMRSVSAGGNSAMSSEIRRNKLKSPWSDDDSRCVLGNDSRRRRGAITWEQETREVGFVENSTDCYRVSRTSAERSVASFQARDMSLWTRDWASSRERRREFCSEAFFEAFDEVREAIVYSGKTQCCSHEVEAEHYEVLSRIRRSGVLRFQSAQLSGGELSLLSRSARAIVVDPAPAEEVWKLVSALRDSFCPTCSPSTRGKPAVILGNGDLQPDFGPSGLMAVAALVEGGGDYNVGDSLLFSSLSITNFHLGNKGAMAIAKAFCARHILSACRRSSAAPHTDVAGDNRNDVGIHTFCLDRCGIGNAGAVALSLALGGLPKCKSAVVNRALVSTRKLVLSGNPIGGVTACARALRHLLSVRGGRLEVLDLSRCSVTDDDMLVLSKGLADPRCCLLSCSLAGNVDLRDTGVDALAEAVRIRSERSAGSKQQSLRVDLNGCSVNTWGCLSLAAAVLDNNVAKAGRGGTDQAMLLTLELGNNRVKDVGVEAMSCAVLGEDYDDHRSRQRRSRRQRQQQRSKATSPHPRDTQMPIGEPLPHSATLVVGKTAPAIALALSQQNQPQHVQVQSFSSTGSSHPPGPGHLNNKDVQGREGELPPLTGTPLFTAATAHVRGSTSRLSRAAVTLDNSMTSVRTVIAQHELSRLGEAALFRGCVLPESILSVGVHGPALNTVGPVKEQ